MGVVNVHRRLLPIMFVLIMRREALMASPVITLSVPWIRLTKGKTEINCTSLLHSLLANFDDDGCSCFFFFFLWVVNEINDDGGKSTYSRKYCTPRTFLTTMTVPE